MDLKMNPKKGNELSQKDFDVLFKYLKSVLSINKTLSTAFMGITLTAFIFLISLGYPDILELELIIGGISIKSVPSSLSFLVLSFFFFLTSTFLFYYSELKLQKFYLYLGSKLTLSERYEKSEKLLKVNYYFAKIFFLYGVIVLILAVILIFFIFSPGGIFIVILTLMSLVPVLVLIYVNIRLKKV